MEQIIGTSIIVDDNMVTIKSIFGKKKIAIDSINNLNIEQYERYRRGSSHYTEYRMRMIIGVNTGKNIILTDKASAEKGTAGFILNTRERVPDEDVNLYKAYQVIKAKINR